MSTTADPLANRLRGVPTWRVLALATGTVLVTLLAIVLLVIVADATAAASPLPPGLHQPFVGLPVVLAIYETGRRYVLRSPPAWFLVGRPDRRLLAWVGVGLVFPPVVLGIQLLVLDVTRVGGSPDIGTAVRLFVATIAAALLAGVLEELALRGALLRLLEVRWGSRLAVAGSAAIFALLHQGHAQGTVELGLVLASMFAAGCLLAVVTVRTRSVWNAVAIHTGWNIYFGGHVVAVAQPGTRVDPAVFQYQIHGSSIWLTGGGATLGAAPLTTALLLLATLAVARIGQGWNPRASTGQTREVI